MKSFSQIKQRSTYRHFKVLDSLGIPYGTSLPTSNSNTSRASIFVLINSDPTKDAIYSYDPVANQWNPITSYGSGDGKSAYEIAVDNGFVGTVTEWLASLHGNNGKSAYQVWLDVPNVGTVDDFLESLKGTNGVGIPPGGLAGQVYGKKSDDNFDGEWIDRAVGTIPFGIATVPSANYYQVTTTPAIASYTEGLPFLVKIPPANTDVPHLIVGGLSSKEIKLPGGISMTSGDLKADAIYWFMFIDDGVDGYYQAVVYKEGGSSIASTDELAEGSTNLYFTDARAKAAVDISGKVDKVAGKGLSDENYTLTEKNKLSGLNNYNDTALSNKIGDLSTLTTTDKSDLVKAVNEVNAKPSGGGGIKATAAELNAGTDDAKFATAKALQDSKYVEQSGAKLFAVATGTNTYAVSLTPTVTSLPRFLFIQFTNGNTGSSTINIDSLGAVAITNNSLPLVSGDILSNQCRLLILSEDLSAYQLQNGNFNFPKVSGGEKAITITSTGIQKTYEVVNPLSANVAALMAADWSSGVVTGITGYETQSAFSTDNNYRYDCINNNGTWKRTSMGFQAVPQWLADIDDTAADKTSAQLQAAYPTSLVGQKVRGKKNHYTKMTSTIWDKTPTTQA